MRETGCEWVVSEILGIVRLHHSSLYACVVMAVFDLSGVRAGSLSCFRSTTNRVLLVAWRFSCGFPLGPINSEAALGRLIVWRPFCLCLDHRRRFSC